MSDPERPRALPLAERAFFEESPIPAWEKDYSGVMEALDRLRASGVEDFPAYLSSHQHVVRDLVSRIRVLDVNRAALRLFRAETKDELLRNPESVFIDASYEAFIEEFSLIAEGKPVVNLTAEIATLDGERRFVTVWLTTHPDHRETPGRVFVSIVDFTERKLAEDALREAKNRLEKAFETMIDGMLIVDRTGRITHANRAAKRMFGDAPEGRHCDELEFSCIDGNGDPQPPEQLPLALAIREGKGVDACQYGIKGSDGGTQWVSATAAPFSDVDGRLLGAVGGFRDITAEKKAEGALQESEEKFRLLFEKSPDPTFLLDGDTAIDCNEAALRLIHATGKHQIVGRHPSAAAPIRQPDGSLSTEKGREEYEKLVRDGANRFEWLSCAIDGEEYWAEVSQTIIPLGGKRITYSVSRDIGERVKAEKRLRESEERYRVAIEHSNDGVAIVRDGRHLYVNQRFLDMFGFARAEEVLGEGQNIVVHPEDQAMVSGYGRRRQAGKPAPSRYEFKGVRRDGTTIIGEASAAKVTYRGEPAILSYFRDVTQRRRSEEALKESEERYRKVVELSPIGIAICVERAVRFANQSLAHMLGAETPEQLYGVEVLRFVQADFHDVLTEIMRGIEIGGAQTSLMEQKWVRLDGSPIGVAITGFPFNYGGNDAIMAFVEDISERKNAEESLKKREAELETKSVNLEEVNTALKVLLRHRDEEKNALENAILLNLRELVLPYVDKLKGAHMSEKQMAYVGLIESGLNEIISPFLRKMSDIHSRFSSTQIQIIDLIKNGKTTKEIAELLHIGKATVDSHRNNIRKKLGIGNQKINLRTYLLSL